MKILFEGRKYETKILEEYGLTQYFSTKPKGDATIVPFVGYFYSNNIHDTIFILPKVFLFEDTTTNILGSTKEEDIKVKAFGKFEYDEIIDTEKCLKLLSQDHFDEIIFEVSTWIYKSIEKFNNRHPENDHIISELTSNSIASPHGDTDITLLDIILSLIDFNKKYNRLLTYTIKISSRGDENIDWNKTIRNTTPLVIENKPYYIEYRNRKKEINYEEELIVLYYSVLKYLKDIYHFPSKLSLNYKLIPPHKIEGLIESGKGYKRLKTLRGKYFKDELVLLWKLLYAFFAKCHEIKEGKRHNELLLSRRYDRIFEDMIDYLISDEKYLYLKKNKDNKRIDHIYKDKGFLGDDLIFYIGDSKYYLSGKNIETTSRYKQFTYAKNIIQENIRIQNKKAIAKLSQQEEITSSGVRYRDELTEGYNITPNFFIRGNLKEEYITDGRLKFDLESDTQIKNQQCFECLNQFENRIFDRDTLWLEAFDINFLFIISSYLKNTNNPQLKEKLRRLFRESILDLYNNNYLFFKVKPFSSPELFIKKYKQEFYGQMYFEGIGDTIWMAFEKGTMTFNHLQLKFANEAIVNCHQL